MFAVNYEDLIKASLMRDKLLSVLQIDKSLLYVRKLIDSGNRTKS